MVTLAPLVKYALDVVSASQRDHYMLWFQPFQLRIPAFGAFSASTTHTDVVSLLSSIVLSFWQIPLDMPLRRVFNVPTGPNGPRHLEVLQ